MQDPSLLTPPVLLPTPTRMLFKHSRKAFLLQAVGVAVPATPEPQVASFLLNNSGFFRISPRSALLPSMPLFALLCSLPDIYGYILHEGLPLLAPCLSLPVQVVSDKKMEHCFGCCL